MPLPTSSRKLSVAAAVVVAAIAAGCELSTEKKSGHSAQPATRVEVVRPERHTVERSVGEPGQIEAYETTPIHAKIAGYVRKVSVDIGSEIKKGQGLAELWVPEIEADLQEKQAAVEQAVARRAQAQSQVKVAQAAVTSAEAKVGEAQAGLKRAEADLTRWQLEDSRVQQLFNERAQTGTLLDETHSKLRAAEAALDEVQAKVRSAQAALSEARSELEKARADEVAAAATIDVARSLAQHAAAMLGYSRIEAPFDGIITRRNVDSGHLTRPGSEAPPLFIAVRSDIVTITVDIPEKHSTEVKPGQRARIKIQAMKGRTVEGKVTRTSWALDPKTRTIRTEIDIPNPGAKLHPGLYAYATVILEEHQDVLTVPTTAVVQAQGGAFCFVVSENKASRRPVVLGLIDGALTEIVSGLEGGELVVKANAASLVDGQTVEVQVEAAKTGKP
jgi:RND family efflux transporter MFP subunit